MGLHYTHQTLRFPRTFFTKNFCYKIVTFLPGQSLHDCIFLSNSVGHDSLSSRLIWSVRVWLCTQFGGLMSSLGSRKPSFFFFDEENQNELTSILIKQSCMFVTSAERQRDIFSTYRSMLFVFMKTVLIMFRPCCLCIHRWRASWSTQKYQKSLGKNFF